MAVNDSIYMDYNATTPVEPRVLEAMLPYFTEVFGNAASVTHGYGAAAHKAVDYARSQVASLINAQPEEIIWTSGATESDNLAIRGVAEMYASKGNHIITCTTEHKAVLETCDALQRYGFDVTYLEPDETGQVSAQQVDMAITDQTILITLMAANNEIGTLHPVAQIGKVAKERGVLFHSDATQAVGKEPVDVEAMGIDLMSLSAHKLYGPKGVGALYVRRKDPKVRLAIQMHGGGHERGFRSGTLNVPGIVGLGAAAEIAQAEMAGEAARLRVLRDRLWDGLSQLEFVRLNGHPTERLCNTLNVAFGYIEGESLILKVPEIAVATGSACTSASLRTSHVLEAIGVEEGWSHGSIRFSLGRYTTAADIDYAIERIRPAVAELRELSPLYELAKEGFSFDE
jgi:cysteine desulfurase